MTPTDFDIELQNLSTHAWDSEVRWAEIEAWAANFSGSIFDAAEEQSYAKYALTRFNYFGKRLIREMLRSLYRDQLESPLRQRIRRRLRDAHNKLAIDKLYQQELSSTRFVAVGNPAESGAHLLYYFRQVNRLAKNLFVDCAAAFSPVGTTAVKSGLAPRDASAKRYIFFDDFVGSGDQSVRYLLPYLSGIRRIAPDLDLRFMSLFASSQGLDRLNERSMFDGSATCLFELDESFQTFSPTSRFFKNNCPPWFDADRLKTICHRYGTALFPGHPLGYENGQFLLGFSHNTPDNTIPVFWYEGTRVPWSPVFVRFDKNYGVSP